ncbi:Flp family type IVb pilin [Aestuariimicrobium soli]|uniref:Flp family type IVb pilin n=1 Tax=Aestuariimicrobium soli TaxID=2035834 RepID=UPI003EB727E6
MVALLVFVQNALLGRFHNKSKGATAVEYGIMVALIAVVIIAGVTLLGKELLALFNSVAGSI